MNGIMVMDREGYVEVKNKSNMTQFERDENEEGEGEEEHYPNSTLFGVKDNRSKKD